MTTGRRQPSRLVVLDRSLEALPLFRLSDSADDSAIVFGAGTPSPWRVLPSPGERLPGTFDQDVYVELLRRYQESGMPADGAVSFTLHAFLRSMGRRVDGRTYEQLRAALTRLHRTLLESAGGYHDATAQAGVTTRLTVLSSVQIDRRRETEDDRCQESYAQGKQCDGPAPFDLTGTRHQPLAKFSDCGDTLDR